MATSVEVRGPAAVFSSRRTPAEPEARTRNSLTASTTTQSRKTPMSMRSQSPIHGVGRFSAIRGASTPVRAPNATSTTRVARE